VATLLLLLGRRLLPLLLDRGRGRQLLLLLLLRV
jgi:hypothetical protein